jgi:hypothetical protein
MANGCPEYPILNLHGLWESGLENVRHEIFRENYLHEIFSHLAEFQVAHGYLVEL